VTLERVRGWGATPWVSLVARLVFAGVLAAAGGLKLADSPAEQERAVRAYQLLPEGVDTMVGYTLPLLELILALLLLVGLGTRITAAVSGLLMVAFVVGVASAWARGLTIDCGCFGGGGEVAASETKYPEEILRDIGLVLLGAWLVLFGAGRFALDGRSRPNGNPDPESTDLEDVHVETASGRDE
jgi:uncharacterized membrane protein YphA (DoxX/SURF4 family)